MTIADGTSGLQLMENAGKATACKAMKMFSPKSRLLVLCGPGNNGGDGFVAARLLRENGYETRLVLSTPIDNLKGDAALAARTWPGRVRAFSPEELEWADAVVDALFGTGLKRDISGDLALVAKTVNKAQKPVLAIDLPSGIDASTGQVRGVAIQASATISFFRRKTGHLLYPGRQYCKTVEIADIGIPEQVLQRIKVQTFANEPALWLSCFPIHAADGHKYNRGHVVVLSGHREHTGAARLAARAALRIGAGLVSLICPEDALAINAAQLTAIMVRSYDSDKHLSRLLEDERINCIVAGPGAGVGKETRGRILHLLRSNKALVLDADALTSFENRPEKLFAAIKKRQAPTLITPHDGEYQRLFKKHINASKKKAEKLNDRLTRARFAARTSGATTILKGADTVIAEPGGRAAINANAPPSLATAGSGDVLAGLAGGLLARKMPAFEAACAAVWLHGDAATAFGAGLIAEDLPECLPGSLRHIQHMD